ncbi:hypothetical protein PMAYCL1PPCAC_23986 [Pristionchus mayeri]|uniref:DNA mismatch repair proteins mutS family domain-containing protein n=1 Tax=Pristionchus mayeri TaxID=1317129 RepID=A0AAN5I841_9BILA|nr:hypothetical protein PMAYCL1PPCAC_23986 [Pristionchus mayeri]
MSLKNPADVSLLRILREKAKGSVSIFEKQDFYGIYDDDAMLVAREIFKSEVGVKRIQIGEKRIPYISLGGGQYERVIRELLVVLRYRVQLYKSVNNTWTLKCTGTAGNMEDFEEIGELGREAAPLISVNLPHNRKIHGKNYAAIIDPSSLRITFAELEDDDKLSHLEQCILSSNAKEAVIVGNPPTDRISLLKTMLRRSNVMCTIKPQPAEKTHFLRLLKEEEREKISTLPDELHCALYGVADYIKLVHSGWASKFSLNDYSNGRFMRLDSCAVRAFELFSPSNVHGGMQATAFSTLNRCKTVAGQKLLKEWLARPLCDQRQIMERQDVIEGLIHSSSLLKTLHSSHLDKLPDLSFLARKLLRKKARLIDCYRIAQAIGKLTPMRECVLQIAKASPECSSAIKDVLLLPIVWGCEQFKDLVECVDQVVDDSSVKVNGLRIKASISPDLQKIANKLEDIDKKAKRSLSKMCDRLGSSGIKLDTTPQHGYVYRVTMKEEKQIRGASGIKIIDGGKGAGVRFRDSILESINEEFVEINAEYQRAQKELEDTVVQICATYAGALSRLSSLLAVVDCLSSLAIVAISASKVHVRPKILPLGSNQFAIKNGRHLVLDFLLPDYIPNDVDLTETRALIVTGANMGGKSTYLRSTALISIIAQMGAFVPADSAELSMVEAVHARVGASDRLSKGLSTFMSEMLECAKMIKSATRDSLVVVDEIGRGTSTFDGFGLAWGITAELINNVGCRLLVATHFTELAQMNDPPRVRSIHMKVLAQDTLTLLYKAEVQERGVADSMSTSMSLGLNVARMVGMDEETLAMGHQEFERLERIEKLKREEKRSIVEVASSQQTSDDCLRDVIKRCTTF